MKSLGLALVLLLCLGAAPRQTPSSSLTPARRAQLLHRWAQEAMDLGTPDGRAIAVQHLTSAIALEPANPDHWILLGRVRMLGEYDQASRDCFRRALTLDPRNVSAALELSAAWKREWARTLDTLALRSAMGVLDTATALHPFAADAWLRLVPLRFEIHDYAGAARAAGRALAGRPRRPEAAMAAAYVAFHEGAIERSDSLFRATIPHLDPALARLFDDPRSTLGQAAPAQGWQGLDPDPTTPENELELEYWSRVAHAFLLFYDPDRPGTDARLQIYVQYGPPESAALNPDGVALNFRTFASATQSDGGGREAAATPKVVFPTPIQVWQYPELGMRLVLQDRSLHGRFQPRASIDADPGARPDPRVFARRSDLLALGDGIAVFHRQPPEEQRIAIRGLLARFGGPGGPRILAHVEVDGSPTDSLRARWVIADTSGRLVRRGEQVLALDACDPAARRAGQFVAELPPGAYRVTVSVRGANGKRGLFETGAAVARGEAGLELSDLVLACGDPSLLIGGGSARFDANVDAHVTGPQMAGYLEIYGLTPGADGASHFEYRCEVRHALPVGKRPRRGRDERAVLVSTTREETQPGAMRRQFVIVPLQSLPTGSYELEVRVKDLTSGAVASRIVDFVHD